MTRRRPARGVVRVDADARRDRGRRCARELHGSARPERDRAPDADDHEADDAGRVRALHDRVGAFVEVLVSRWQCVSTSAEHAGRERSPHAGATLDAWARATGKSDANHATYMVFAQRPDARVEIEAWSAHAERFFATRLGLTAEKRYAPGEVPREDAARFVIAPEGEAPGIREATARPCDASDLARATMADERVGPGGTGLALLARRCQTVWLVEQALDPDPLALRLATILASIFLGPILDARVPELFGVKTARAKLEAMGRLEAMGERENASQNRVRPSEAVGGARSRTPYSRTATTPDDGIAKGSLGSGTRSHTRSWKRRRISMLHASAAHSEQ